MSTTRDDLRYALRSLGRNPGFTCVAVVSLALGVGVNTTIFSLVDQLLLWSVPARDPNQLVNIADGLSDTYPFYREYRDRNQVFSGLVATSHPVPCGLRPEGAPAAEAGHVSYISGNYFQTLGVGTTVGRVLVDSDDRKPGGSPVVILTYAYWQRRFAGSRGVIGRKLLVNGYPLEIAGVAERGFGGLFNGLPTDAFIPLTMFPLTTPAAAAVWNTPSMGLLTSVGRLKPGVSIGKAQANLRVLWPQAKAAVNDASVKAGGRARKFSRQEPPTLTPGVHGISYDRAREMNPLAVLMAAAGLVLLIACANIANLLLARAAGRRKEIAVRLAMGARRARLVRQLLTESLVLAGLGGVAGFALARWTIAALAAAHLVDSNLRFEPSLALAAFSLSLTLLTSVLFGLVPALRITRLDLAQATRDSGGASPGRARVRLGKALIAAQAALSLTLLVGAGLFIRTLHNLNSVDLGFDRQSVLLIDADAAQAGYHGHRLRTFYDELLERTRRLPGVRAAALSEMTPMGMYSMVTPFAAEGYQPHPGEDLVAFENRVSDGYFATLGTPLLLGRDFRPSDEPAVTPRDSDMAALGRMSGGGSDAAVNASPICIIDESLARRLFGGASPVGRHLAFDDAYSAKGAIEIVGVVKDVRNSEVRRGDTWGMIYVPSWSQGAEARFLAVRIAGGAAPAIAGIARQLRQLDPNVPLLRSGLLAEDVNARIGDERMIAFLCGCFGALALVLAAVGLYGVMAYAVEQRTREVGIRMALGAQRLDVVRTIVREALAPVLGGVMVGVAGALAVVRFAASMLFGVAPRDPLSFALAGSVLLAVALAAAAIPARRASRVDPAIALRYE